MNRLAFPGEGRGCAGEFAGHVLRPANANPVHWIGPISPPSHRHKLGPRPAPGKGLVLSSEAVPI